MSAAAASTGRISSRDISCSWRYSLHQAFHQPCCLSFIKKRPPRRHRCTRASVQNHVAQHRRGFAHERLRRKRGAEPALERESVTRAAILAQQLHQLALARARPRPARPTTPPTTPSPLQSDSEFVALLSPRIAGRRHSFQDEAGTAKPHGHGPVGFLVSIIVSAIRRSTGPCSACIQRRP